MFCMIARWHNVLLRVVNIRLLQKYILCNQLKQMIGINEQFDTLLDNIGVYAGM